MTYEEIVAKVSERCAKADAKAVSAHSAIQFNVYGEGEGAFYIEVSDGKINVAPYEYYDHDAVISTPAEILINAITAKITMDAFTADSTVTVTGNAAALTEIKFKKERKAAVKKAVAETTTEAVEEKPAKKTAAKKTTKKAAETAEKPAAKKAAAKKTTAKKTAAKKTEA